MALGTALAATLGTAVFLGRDAVLHLYTADEAVVAAAMPLLAWLALFHVADAVQTIAAFVLRAWRVAAVPMFIYAGTLWGVGLGGGYVLAFNVGGAVPEAFQGARGFWTAATVGLVVASVALVLFKRHVLNRKATAPHPTLA
jgi:MATE family multidrug resistance protein